MNYYLKTFKQATERQLSEGITWYSDAHDHALKIANYTGATLYQVAGVISALSPMKEWTMNLRIANDFIQHFNETGHALSCHFGNNIKKAHDIMLSDGDYESVQAYFKHGTKTHSFYLNLTGDLSAITWDSHMINLANSGKRKSISNTISLSFTKAVKDNATKQVMKLCKLYDLQPAQVQAVLWVVYRELEIVKK